jgi:FtsP/CotA-like multicopper oxidase with cupredoxin domain
MSQTIYETLKSDAVLWRLSQNNSLGSQHVFNSPHEGQGSQIIINSLEMMAHPWHLQ